MYTVSITSLSTRLQWESYALTRIPRVSSQHLSLGGRKARHSLFANRGPGLRSLCASGQLTYVQSSLEFAIAAELDEYHFVQAQSYQIEGLVARGRGVFGVRHGSYILRC